MSTAETKMTAAPVADEKKPAAPETAPETAPGTDDATGVRKEPIAFPAAGCGPPPRAPLTEAQAAKYAWLLAEARGWTRVAASAAEHLSEEQAGPLTDAERQWLTRECLLRFLRATKWQEKEAARRLQATLAWRRAYGVEALQADKMGPENETGKQLLLGYDKEGRVCHYLRPGHQNTHVSPRQVQHLVYMAERDIDLMPPGQETLALLINFQASKNRANTAPSISTGREVLHILQTHYPERLGLALVVNVPWIVWGFFKLITPFIDPQTRHKLKFNEDMTQYVPAEQLWTEFGGKLAFDYDHDVYWPALVRLAAERRAARTERWVAGGKHIGEYEDYLGGLLDKGVAAAEAGPAEAAGPAAQ